MLAFYLLLIVQLFLVSSSKAVKPTANLGQAGVLDNNIKKVVRRASLDAQNKKKVAVNALQPHGLSNLKVRIEGKVKQAQQKVNISKDLSDKEKSFKLHLLEMFLEELRESDKDLREAEEALKKALTMDFWNSSTLKENSKKRLDALRLATLKEEKSLNRMHEFDVEIKKYMNEANSSSWVGEILKEISHAADQLQDSVGGKELTDDEMKLHRGHIEAVMHVKDGGDDNTYPEFEDENIGDEEDDRMDMLIDSKNNKYVLTRQKDATSPFVDRILVLEIVLLLLFSVPLGFMCQLIGVPTLFGYILAGVILGPSGINIMQEMIQIETLGELGVFMIMFCAGLEFSLERLLKVWRIAVQVPIYTTLIMILSGIMIGSVLMKGIPASESAFVSACLSLSSTPLVTRFLQGGNRDSGSMEYSSILLGMLVVQDIQLSIIIAILPGLAAHRHGENLGDAFLRTSAIVIKTTCSIGFVVSLITIFSRYVMPHYVKLLVQQTRELQLLGALFVMYACQVTTSFLGISMELGCFIAGAVLSHTAHLGAIEQKVFAVHDLLSVIFFATIGFHVFPTFVFLELTLLLFVTLFVVAAKYLVCLLVLRFVLPSQSRKLKWILSSGLAQVSEFSFVLGSRARHLKIISREVFLLILSATTLSLLLAPVLWKLSLWRYRLRHDTIFSR